MKSSTSILMKRQAARKVLAYLAEHPEAQDTLEGIVQWWLLKQEIKWRIATVKEALADLIVRGFVLKRKGKDSRTRYSINKQKAEEIRTFLSERRKLSMRS